jgi:retron-type reverse transcriptase
MSQCCSIPRMAFAPGEVVTLPCGHCTTRSGAHTVDWLLAMDLARFFDPIPHREMLAVRAERIADRAFLRLIARLFKAGVQPPGGVGYDELGSPQGSLVSPVIAHAVLATM